MPAVKNNLSSVYSTMCALFKILVFVTIIVFIYLMIAIFRLSNVSYPAYYTGGAEKEINPWKKYTTVQQLRSDNPELYVRFIYMQEKSLSCALKISRIKTEIDEIMETKPNTMVRCLVNELPSTDKYSMDLIITEKTEIARVDTDGEFKNKPYPVTIHAKPALLHMVSMPALSNTDNPNIFTAQELYTAVYETDTRTCGGVLIYIHNCAMFLISSTDEIKANIAASSDPDRAAMCHAFYISNVMRAYTGQAKWTISGLEQLLIHAGLKFMTLPMNYKFMNRYYNRTFKPVPYKMNKWEKTIVNRITDGSD